MNNSQYSPTSRESYSSKDLNTDFKGAKFTVTANGNTNCDFKVLDDSILDGLVLDVVDSALGDKITFQVIDKDNVLGYGENVVLKQFATDIYVAPGIVRQVDYASSYPAKIYAGLYLRMIYTSTSLTLSPTILIRYKLHKILW